MSAIDSRGDQINFPGNVGTPKTDLLAVKLLVNSVISTPGAEWFKMDIKNFYLNTLMARKEYLRLKLSKIPNDAIEEYGIRDNATADS